MNSPEYIISSLVSCGSWLLFLAFRIHICSTLCHAHCCLQSILPTTSKIVLGLFLRTISGQTKVTKSHSQTQHILNIATPVCFTTGERYFLSFRNCVKNTLCTGVPDTMFSENKFESICLWPLLNPHNVTKCVLMQETYHREYTHRGVLFLVTYGQSNLTPVGAWSPNGMSVCVCACVCMSMCVCVSVCVWERACMWTEWNWSMHYVGIST